MEYETESSDESNSSDAFSSESSSEEESDIEVDDDSYNPDGIDSDDDGQGCCHWSTEPGLDTQDTLKPDESLNEYGTPETVFEDETKPHEIIERIMDDEFIKICIDATNEHGASDQRYLDMIHEIGKDEKGISFMRGFFAIKWHLRILRYPQMRWAWSEDPLRGQPEIKKTMTLEVFKLMLKHFRAVKQSELPDKRDPSYHPLQNINAGIEYLRQKSLSHWNMGWKMCIDEGRVRSKSKRNPFKVRNPDKPIRMGWTICKISDKGVHGGNFVGNHVVKVGRKTYKNTENGKNYDVVDQLLTDYKDRGRQVVMDSGFPTMKLMTDSKDLWSTRLIATQRGRTAHLPASHADNIKTTKTFARGFSKSLHCGFVNLTYWNDNNAVVFLDNDVNSGRETWNTIEVNQGEDDVVIHVPKVGEIYREVYGWVDRTNQQLSYYNTEFRSVRKQSRVFDSLCEMYVLVNGHTLWRNSQNLIAGKTRDACTQSSFRFEIIRAWYAMFKKSNGRMGILHYPSRKLSTHKRTVEMTLMSPNKGHHDQGTPNLRVDLLPDMMIVAF